MTREIVIAMERDEDNETAFGRLCGRFFGGTWDNRLLYGHRRRCDALK
jgi:hypothetical protein